MKNKIFVYLFGVFFVIGCVFYVGQSTYTNIAFAAPFNPNDIASQTGLSQGTGTYPIVGVISNVLKFVTGLIAGLAILMIVIGGIMYIASGGDDSRTETAKKIILYAIVGLVVALLAYVIVKSVDSAMIGGATGSADSATTSSSN